MLSGVLEGGESETGLVALVLEGFTPQPYKPINRISPIGLDLELLSWPPKVTPKVPVVWSSERPRFKVPLGPAEQL